jgi:putative membrane protein
MLLGTFAHLGEPIAPSDVWASWNTSPFILVPLLLIAFIYLRGTLKLWRRAGIGRGLTARRFLSFLGAILALGIGLVSPLDALSETLFWAHMVQHLVLILVAAPLLALSDFPLALFWALPRPWAHLFGHRLNQTTALLRAWQIISSPLSAWLLFALALWGWHTPVLFETALRNETLHIVEHLVFLLTSILFWWVLFKHTHPDHYHYAMTIPYLFTTVLHSGILGALMTFTSRPWYPYYALLVAPWGFTPLQDQQIAGLIMWIPGGAVFSLLTIFYFAAWLQAMEKHSLNKNFSTAESAKNAESLKISPRARRSLR